MTAVLSATDALRKDRIMGALDDNQINYSSSPVDWRAKYNEVADMLAETRGELDDFHASSKELEEELERELERTEKAQQVLKVKVAKAESERDDWKSKFMSLQTTHNTTTTSLQRELDKLRQEHQQTKIQLRELEMGNDDLERNERAVSSSLADEQAKYSRVLEEKILLEHELLEKANVEEELQRLKDELRDTNVEVSILRDQLTAAQANATASDSSPTAPSSLYPHISTVPSEDNLLSTKPPPDLQLSELSHEDPVPETGTPRQQPTPLTPAAHHESLLHRPINLHKSTPPPGISSLARSSTLPSLTSPPSRIPPRSPLPTPRPVVLRNSASASTSSSATTSKNKGVQMVSEMRARVRNLEQKIHTRVPRLRMGSITARSNANQAGTSSSTPTNRLAQPRASLSDDVKGRRSSESVSDKKEKKTPILPASESSGWVLIMEDSPSPIKVKLTEKEKDQERRRVSSPSALNVFRPRASTSALSSSNSNNRSNPLYHSSVGGTGVRRPQSRQSGASSITTGSSLPSPSSRPSTPTFLPVPSGGLYAHPTTAGATGLKRSTGPGGSTIQQKRSSVGSNTNNLTGFGVRERPTTMPPPPRLSTDSVASISSSSSNLSLSDRDNNKALPQLPLPHSNVTMRPPTKLPASFLSQSRIGRPGGVPSGRRGSDASSGRRSSDLLTVDSGYADEENEEKGKPRSGGIVSPFGFGRSRNGQ